MEESIDSNKKEGIRLNRYISLSGFCSRRKADEHIENGEVTIDGERAEVGARVQSGQQVLINEIPLTPETEKIYIALHKPLYITCTADKDDPDNVIDYLSYPKKIFPIGRLDKMSTGLLLLTNDGDLTYHLLRTSGFHEKEYIVTVNKAITEDFLQKMQSGVRLSDAVTLPCRIQKIDERTCSITLTQGLNRQIRRMCEACGYRVKTLERIRIENIHLGDLEKGKWRHLSEEEKTTLLENILPKK